MKITKNTKFLIVGLGVMGGGYAKALSKQGYYVSALTLNQADIDFAIKNGIIAEGSTEIDERLIAEADIIIFALYPHIFVEWIEKNQSLFRSGTIITDVTGVKECIVDKIQGLLREDVEFIATHPMAGRERSGLEYSDDKVFRGANYIVTPTEKNSASAVEAAKKLGELLGFGSISELTPKRHDEIIGFLSQLTHCIAVSLMTCEQSVGMEKYTGDSFRDLTRIAKINDEMWSELFLLNRDALLRQMNEFEGEFNKLKEYLLNGDRDGMRAMMRKSCERRALFDKKA